MDLEQLRAAHPEACAALAKEEQRRVLTHLDIGRNIDCPALAGEAVKTGASLAEMLPRYEKAATQHGTSSRFAWCVKHHGLSLESFGNGVTGARDAAPTSPNAGAIDFGDRVADELEVRLFGRIRGERGTP